MNAALIWFIASILLFAAEIITPGFVLACFGAGALVACIPALLGLGIVWQVLVFALGSLLALFLLRPLLQRLSKNKKTPTTGMDALIGKKARVVRVVSSRQGGRVAIDGDEWPAVVLAEDLEIPQDVFVKVVSYDSIVLVVEPFES
ncbi:NfeD family protein [Porphyromonas endodontalis]|uniref:NfeD family protein n=1 Tax=Porphyromonas endodontalis TaxID=28124 RepID=UPI00288060BF|nr:NfeD family protein [Porphyromonas endodontalis]